VKCEGGEGGDNINRKKTKKLKELKENSNIVKTKHETKLKEEDQDVLDKEN
jgi:hypothetical protein